MNSTVLPTALVCNGVPAVVEWILQNQNERADYLKEKIDGPPHWAMVDVHYDESRSEFMCKLCVSVNLKRINTKRHIYILLAPAHISRVELCRTVPTNVTNAFVTSNRGLSAEDILGIHFSLKQPGVVVSPKPPADPGTRAMRKLLESVFSCGSSRDITIYVQSNAVEEYKLQHMFGQLNQLVLHGFPIIDTLYGGKGGRIVQDLEELSKPSIYDPTDLPTYDQIVSTTPNSDPPRSEKRRISSPGTKEPQRKKLAQEDSTESAEPWKLAFAALAAQFTAMQQEIRTHRNQTADAGVQTTPTKSSQVHPVEPAVTIETGTKAGYQTSPSMASTVEDSVEDRLLIVEHSMSDLRKDVSLWHQSLESKVMQSIDSVTRDLKQRVGELLDDRLTYSIDTAMQDLMQKVEDQLDDRLVPLDSLDEQIRECCDNVNEDMRAFLDGELAEAKLELQEFVEDEMRDVEETVTSKVRSAVSQASLHIDL